MWLIGQRFPRERWVFAELKRMNLASGSTRGLNKLCAAMTSFDSRDFEAKNNLAATSMLHKLKLARAHELAREVYLEHPDESIVASTYAYSLHLQGRTKEGLAALEKLNKEALENPPIALYFGLLLNAAGETNKAVKFLSLARQAKL